MLGMEEILRELGGGSGGCTAVHEEDHHRHRHGLPPGFRFHPTDEELITFYLASKVLNNPRVNDIAEIDLNRCEPWELPEAAKMGEREWYFFSLRDRKYPTGLRTNRATCAGYWKATGKDREVYGNGNSNSSDDQQQMIVVGMKKTLVFYKGRAPRGEKTKWVMHEYRLDVDFFHRHSCKEEWVICRILHKIGEKKPNLLISDQTLCHLNLIRGCSISPSSAAAAGGGFLLPALLESPPAALMESQSHNHNHQEKEEDGRLIISMESLQKNPFKNNLIINNQKQEESYVQQIKSVINPVFSNNLISPAPAMQPPSSGNVWAEFMGIPFVTGDIIVGDHELLMAADRHVSSSSSSLISLF